MELKKVSALFFILCMILVISGCGGGLKDTGGGLKEEPVSTHSNDKNGELAEQPIGTEKTDKKSSADFQKISDFANYWNDLYKQNEAAINKYEGKVRIQLASAGLTFVSGVQYDLLNMENKNGRFEGELMMAGYPAFVEKSGPKLSFGHDFVRKKDSFDPSIKAGDRAVENGSCDLSEGIYQTEEFNKRNEQILTRDYNEFKRIKNGEMIYLGISCYSSDIPSEQEKSWNYCTYIKAGKDKFDFVVGKAAQGTAFEKLSFVDRDDFSKDEARQMMEAAGYEIEASGGIVGGVLAVD